MDGDPSGVEAIIAWARRGPRAGLVASVEVSDIAGSFSGFARLPNE